MMFGLLCLIIFRGVLLFGLGSVSEVIWLLFVGFRDSVALLVCSRRLVTGLFCYCLCCW